MNVSFVSADIENQKRQGLVDRPVSSYYRMGGKRLFDLVLALLIFPLAGAIIVPLWIVIALDGGPGFFGHKRIGRNGKVFRCWKLRTMCVNAEERLREHLARHPEAAAEWERDHKLTNDPRITRLGAFLRKTSLDELPQIWNVIRGDMSFVGPRPVVRMEMHKYGSFKAVYKSLTPGITGLWQVSGRNDVSYDERVELDVTYANRLSFLTDLRVIIMTGLAVVVGTGR